MLKTAKKIVNKSVKYKKHFALYIILNVYVLFFFFNTVSRSFDIVDYESVCNLWL